MSEKKHNPVTFLCIATFFKGTDFIKQLKEGGNTVYLLTVEKLKNKPWPIDSQNDIFYLENGDNTSQNQDKMILGLAYVMRSRKIDRIVALDDFDVEKAALLREAFRIPGMGQTTARYFRDKLAMRKKAEEAGIHIPPYSALFNDVEVTNYLQTIDGPWVIKPRFEASAVGIKMAMTFDKAWQIVHSLGDNRHNYLIEQFKPGHVYHVDALFMKGKVIFERANRYLSTPMEVSHGGGVFRSVTVDFGSEDEKALKEANEKVLRAFGMQSSASHTEFIKSRETGEFVFLETSSRVGGANLAEMVEASSGINLWREWANIEVALAREEEYILPKIKKDYSGIVISLCRQHTPDISGFTDKEVVWKMDQEYHVGFIIKDKKKEKVIKLLDIYAERIYKDYHASIPVPDKPTN